MNEPLAYLITWTTYGTWMRGDDRCWVDRRRNQYGTAYDQSEPAREDINRQRMKESPVSLAPADPRAVENGLRQTCRFKGWRLHEISVQWNHVHVVVTAEGVAPEQIQKTLRRYASAAMYPLHPAMSRDRWWTKGGSKRYLFTEESLQRAIAYVRNQ